MWGKTVSSRMLCFQLNWSLSPLWRARREETERCESESGLHVFLTFSWHLMKEFHEKSWNSTLTKPFDAESNFEIFHWSFSLDVKKILKIHRPRILTRSVRFPPFGFATTEISSNLIENTAFYLNHIENKQILMKRMAKKRKNSTHQPRDFDRWLSPLPKQTPSTDD